MYKFLGLCIFTTIIMVFTMSFNSGKINDGQNLPFEPEMVFIEGGTFRMGCAEDECLEMELPVQQVTLSSFRIGKYEITQGQWMSVMGDNPSAFKKGDNYPVEGVTWELAQKFINKLNELTGKNYRLPTEAEWEYAARGGNKSKGYKYSGSNNIDDVAWYGDYPDGSTHPVGEKRSNELGIYDMSGNVWEWCSDWSGPYYTASMITDPTGPASGKVRVLRGGGWDGKATRIRIAARGNGAPNGRDEWRNWGIRIVLP